jgi:3-oxoacyl-[acyl-carrier-protein] synthase-3
MKFEDVYIAGHGSRLPPAHSVEQAVADGLLDRTVAQQTKAVSVTVSEHESGPELAVAAARAALEHAAAAGHTPSVDLLLHADVFYQGHDLWAPASYIQDQVLRNSCPAIEIRQLSNGGMAGLELAASYLAASPEREGALLTAGDRFNPPGFDRWGSDPGTLFADGGSALLLSRRSGFARLLSLATHSDPELERMHRGDDPFSEVPFGVRPAVDIAATQAAFLARTGVSFAVARVSAGQNTVLKTVLAEADLPLDAIDWFVLPHLGHRRLNATYFKPYGIDPERTTWPWSREVGHLGAADQYAGLGHLLDSGRLRPGQRCLLAGIGAGFSWSCAVIEMTG